MVDKVLRRVGGKTQQYTPATSSAGAADAGKLIALGADGKLDPSMYIAGAATTRPVLASEAIGAGKFVNFHMVATALNMRLADNSNSRPAHGFCIVAVAAAATGAVSPLDAVNSALTGLTIAADYYLGTAGGALAAPLDAATATTGSIDQKLGTAISATEMETGDYDYVVL